MAARFDYFIILGAMRTGSNLLEANLNALDGVTGHGEAFNPHFIGRLKAADILGVTLDERDRNPSRLLDAIRSAPDGLHGFRYFQEHDPRVLEPVLDDPRCAKIILNRNPLDSYLSLKIARTTKQWQLKNITRRLEAQVSFKETEFQDYLETRRIYLNRLHSHLQKSGQTAFHIDYDDLTQLDVLNGLAAWLGVSARLDRLDDTLKPQNPAPPLSKVSNPEEMTRALSQHDSFDLHRLPGFEPRRAAAVGSYVAAPKSPLMYLPVRSGLEDVVTQWMAAVDGVSPDQLITNRNRRQTQMWLQSNPGHRKFTVLRHPLARAHTAFCQRILTRGPGSYQKIRHALRNRFDVPIPGEIRDHNYSADQHYEAFAGFLSFLRLNLSGQTAIRVDGTWCSQSHVLEGMSVFALPDLILREDELPTALPDLARRIGHETAPLPQQCPADTPFALEQIYDDRLEALAAETYQRDYVQFGFEAWTPNKP